MKYIVAIVLVLIVGIIDVIKSRKRANTDKMKIHDAVRTFGVNNNKK